MRGQIRKLGNSQGLIIPKPLLDEAGLKAGDAVELKINRKGRLVIAPARPAPRARASTAPAPRPAPRAGWSAESRALTDATERDFQW